MIKKEVKAYGKSQRQRIDFNKGDHLEVGQEVNILTNQEYEELLECQSELQKVKSELIAMQNQEVNLKELIQDVTAPIYENHKKELENKDIELKGLRLQLELMKEKTNRFNLELMSLNTIDVLFRRKHKNIIYDFQDEFTQISKDDPLEIEK